ncbi:MAG: hypothetical protein QM768_17505 [Agriterribacter sp.]
MVIKIFLEWNEYIGIRLNEASVLVESIELFFKDKNYGVSIEQIMIVMTALDRDWKQRKKYKKDKRRFDYDILLDFFGILDAEGDEKKRIVCNQMIEITEATFSKYKFEDFDKVRFLTDFKNVVSQAKW